MKMVTLSSTILSLKLFKSANLSSDLYLIKLQRTCEIVSTQFEVPFIKLMLQPFRPKQCTVIIQSFRDVSAGAPCEEVSREDERCKRAESMLRKSRRSSSIQCSKWRISRVERESRSLPFWHHVKASGTCKDDDDIRRIILCLQWSGLYLFSGH